MDCSTEAPSPVYGVASMVKKPCGHAIWLISAYTIVISFFMERLKTALTATVEVVCSCFMIKVVLWSLVC